MPSTIPYDGSLALADVVTDEAIAVISKIKEAQQPADAAQDAVKSLFASKRNLETTKAELLNLGVPTPELDKEIADLDAQIEQAAAAYTTTKDRVDAEVQRLRGTMPSGDAKIESPVDQARSEIKTMPLAADSVSLDVQYFPCDVDKRDAFAESISSFVATATKWMGTDASSQMAKAAQEQAGQQTAQRAMAGTLILSVSCTHKNAAVLAPFVLQVDKGIKVWNEMFKGERIDPTDTRGMVRLVAEEPRGVGEKYSIVSGASFGSCFVGMVHVLDAGTTNASESLSSLAASLQSKMDAGSWSRAHSGGFGMDNSIAEEIKSGLSAQGIKSHVTLVSMGSMQSESANDRKRSFGQLAPVEKDQGLDIESMMAALDEFLKRSADDRSGVPINYYLKDVTKRVLAEIWVAKYYPGKYEAIKNDDGDTSGANSLTGGES